MAEAPPPPAPALATTGALRLVSSMAARGLLAELAAAGPAEVELTAIGGVDAARRVAAGEPFDLVVLASDALAPLSAGGHLAPGGRVELVHSPMAAAVRAGTPPPPIDTEPALRAALTQARRIAHSTGPSGAHLRALIDRWGMAAALAPRLLEAPPGVPVARLLADGRADLGFQQLSELQGAAGVEVLGPLPPSCAFTTCFAGAVTRCARDGTAAAAWLAWAARAAVPRAARHGLRAALHAIEDPA